MKFLFSFLLVLVTFCIYSQESHTFTDERDGKSYRYVQLGDQIWMAENLKFWVPKDSPHYIGPSYFYEGLETNYHRYGRLYDWHMTQKVCPTGWHIPSLAEWKSMINTFGELYNAEGRIPTKKEISKEEVKLRRQLFKDIRVALADGGSAGFNVQLGGYRDAYVYLAMKQYFHKETQGNYWTSDDKIEDLPSKKNHAWVFRFTPQGFLQVTMPQSHGLSIRCIKDNDEHQE